MKRLISNIPVQLAAVTLLMLTTAAGKAQQATAPTSARPNIILIYADDLGYGDVSCYGATKLRTPNIDKLAAQGQRFTNAHTSSATCTPSRYSLLTGKYAWRQQGTGVAPGDASLLIQPGTTTLPGVLQQAGYTTAAVGKWHLGLGTPGSKPDWNGEIRPGPLEIGFSYSFIMPATADRVPCVFMENHRVLNLDPADPINVNYKGPIGQEPTGKNNPELLQMKASHGHNQAIVNGIGRIGYMTGGKAALWNDSAIAHVLTEQSVRFIARNREKPFFLYLATHDIHVPRVPHADFAGKSGMGARGDVILELDWTVGRIMHVLDSLHLSENTLVIFSSDNGPVVDDGYQDQAVELLNGHKPAGPLRGGKYSAFDGGTRVPMIVKWPGHVKQGITNALISQVDLLASLAVLTRVPLDNNAAPDSFDMLEALLGTSSHGRSSLVEHAGTLGLIRGQWKYITPGKGPKKSNNTNTELGNDMAPQLYNLNTDLTEQHNLAAEHPELVKEMAGELEKIKKDGRSR